MSRDEKPLKRSFIKRLGYACLRTFSRTVGVLIFRLRCQGRQWQPTEGGGLVCSNHQSLFDPVLVGVAFDRRLNYLARRSLFRFAPFRWLIEFLDAIPIDRDGTGLGGLKESLKRLRRGELVLIFPEGSRTLDGRVALLKPGFVALARRGRVPLIPVAIDGAFQAWPRTALFPRPAVVHVCIGQPLTQDEIQQLTDEQLVEELQRRIEACFAVASQRSP